MKNTFALFTFLFMTATFANAAIQELKCGVDLGQKSFTVSLVSENNKYTSIRIDDEAQKTDSVSKINETQTTMKSDALSSFPGISLYSVGGSLSGSSTDYVTLYIPSQNPLKSTISAFVSISSQKLNVKISPSAPAKVECERSVY